MLSGLELGWPQLDYPSFTVPAHMDPKWLRVRLTTTIRYITSTLAPPTPTGGLRFRAFIIFICVTSKTTKRICMIQKKNSKKDEPRSLLLMMRGQRWMFFPLFTSLIFLFLFSSLFDDATKAKEWTLVEKCLSCSLAFALLLPCYDTTSRPKVNQLGSSTLQQA